MKINLCTFIGHRWRYHKEKYNLLPSDVHPKTGGEKYFSIRRCSRCECAEKFLLSCSWKGHPFWGGGGSDAVWVKWKLKEGATFKLKRA